MVKTIYKTTLLAVKDLELSKKFYKEIFNEDVVVDLGWNITLSSGLALQLNFDKLVEFDNSLYKWKPYNMEIYYETEYFDAFLELINKHSEVKILHEAKTYPWLQRVIRIFDPDDHIIEIGESMEAIAHRLFSEGKNIDEVVEMI